jgi:hypothetical protein
MSIKSFEEEVRDVEATRAKAMVATDVATLDALTSESYVHVESTGQVRTKAQFLEGLTRGEYSFESFVIDETLVRIFGQTAVVTGSYHNVIRTSAGIQPVKYARCIRVYVRDNSGWRNVSHQATEYPAPPPSSQ